MREAAEALTFGAYLVREDFADVHPNDGALRERKEPDVADQQPYQQVLVASGKEYGGNSGETYSRSDGADQQQDLATKTVDDRHGQHGEHQVRRTYRNR